MRILQLIYESLGSPFGFGGAGVRAYEIYRRLKDAHEIVLLCMKYPGARDGEREGLRHIFVGRESKGLAKSVLSYTIEAARFVKRHGDTFDIIVENFLPSTPFFSRTLTNTPVILQVQGIMESHSIRKFSPMYSLPMFLTEWFYPRLYKRFIFVSPVTRDKMMSRIGKKPLLCAVIPNGVNRELLDLVPEEDEYLLFFSRIDRYTKGLDLLVEAFVKISAEFPHLKLVLAGYEFDTFDSLLKGVPSALTKRISYAGFVTGDRKNSLLSHAKIIVLPSRHESAPVSILEAAACGKPLIVSDIPELHFVEKKGFGVSFPSGSGEGLEEKIKLLVTDGALRAALGARGREYAKGYSWDSIAVQFERTLISGV